MKKLAMILAMIIAVMMTCALTGCLTTVHFAETATGTIYLTGEQTITLQSPADYPDVKFEKEIRASDITLADDLAGKTVTGVEYVSETCVKVTISGTAIKSESIYSTITVGNHALTGTTTGEYIVSVQLTAPRITAVSSGFLSSGNTVQAEATYSLPYGSFVQEYCTADHIRTNNGTGTVLGVSVNEDGQLEVSIENYVLSEGETVAYIVIDAECTTFDHTVTIAIGKALAGADLG